VLKIYSIRNINYRFLALAVNFGTRPRLRSDTHYECSKSIAYVTRPADIEYSQWITERSPNNIYIHILNYMTDIFTKQVYIEKLHLKVLAAPSLFVFFNIFNIYFYFDYICYFFIKYFNFFNSLYFYVFIFLIYCIHSSFLNSTWRHFLISYFFIKSIYKTIFLKDIIVLFWLWKEHGG